MRIETGNAADAIGVGLISRPTLEESCRIIGQFRAECFDASGNLLWTDDFHNTVVNAGKNDMLDKYLAGSAWTTGSVYMGLKGGVSSGVSATDTMSSHGSWTFLDITAARVVMSFSSASGGSKATASAASHSITSGTGTVVYGVYVVVGGTSANTNTTGTLFSCGDFSASRTVNSGDTLNVTYTVSV